MASDILTMLGASPLIREYAMGQVQQNVGPAADFLAPAVNVAVTKARYKLYNKGEQFKVPDTRRGLGGGAALISFGANDGTVNCEPHALDFPADEITQVDSQETGINILQEGAQVAAQVAALSHEIRVVDKALNTLGAATDVSVSSSDPINAIDGYIKQVMLNSGGFGSLMKVRVLLGIGAKILLKNSSYVRSRYIAAGGSVSEAIPDVTDKQLSNMLVMNPEVLTCATVVDASSDPAKAQSLAFKLDTNVIVFIASPNPTRYDPSFMKTFRLAGKWMTPRIWSSADGRVDYAGWDWTGDVQAPNSSGGVLLNLTNVAV